MTEAQRRAVAHIASAVVEPVMTDQQHLDQALAALAASMPSKTKDLNHGKLQLNTYVAMLRGFSRDAINFACRRCLEDLDWFPTVKQIKDRADQFVSPEQRMVQQAKALLGRVPPRTGEHTLNPFTQAELDKFEIGDRIAMRDLGLRLGYLYRDDAGKLQEGF